ncbi:hypothetical protein MMC07_002808 [Pseudocyphellaria aurata]|nr:hypothetical protein [Pseudocyphellaria aurata]
MLAQTLISVLAMAAGLTAAAPAPVPVTLPLAERDTHSGLGTVYIQGGVPGSCGQVNSDDAMIVAVSNSLMQGQSPSPLCGRQITVRNIGSNDGVGGAGNSMTVTVADTCMGCDENHLDFSVGAWNQLTNNAPYGTVNIEWDL